MNSRYSILKRLFHIGLLFLMLAGLLPAITPVRAAANADQLLISVVSARTESEAPGGPVVKGDPITQYSYLINIDNTGDPSQPRLPGCHPSDAGYPDSCDWPSIREVPSSAPIYTQGDQSDFLDGTGVIDPALGIQNLPPGKYLISVLADGYKMGGAHFSVPLPEPDLVTGANLVVELQPHPLPPATLRIKVFEDISPVNGQFDAPAEHGLAGFSVVINDIAGQVSADVHGNPLCTVYDANQEPVGQTDCLISDANGDITVPNLGPLRYDILVNAPNGETWLETTTLEGSWSWDTWLQEGGTGLDNEFVIAGEPFPWTMFGFVRPTDLLNDPADTGGITGTMVAASVYSPQQGALPYYGDIWSGFNGTKVTGPITDGWIALSDLQNGDTVVYVGPANPDGTFLIENVPDGNYLFTWWDTNLFYILDWIQVTVSDGQIYDMGTPMLTGWFTRVEGYVFIDENKNGIKDPGEPGKADYVVVLRDRDNSEIDRMSIAVTTDHDGYYIFEKAYPMNSWMVLEAYNDRYYTTGVTYQVENQPTPTTVLGGGVDVGFLPVLGQSARLDWGVHPYEPGTNGGIAGSVFYDTTRNELDPRYQAVEGWAPGIPDLTMNLYAPVFCGTNPGATCDLYGVYELAPDGSYAKGELLNTTTTETWVQPTGCIARDANGEPLPFGAPNQEVLPIDPNGNRCLEGPLMGTQLESGFAALDGNWGFADGCFGPGGALDEGVCADGNQPTPLGAGDYLVEVEIPNDTLGRPMYNVVREEDINVFGGDQYTPAVPPPACAGPLHVVDVAGVGVDGPLATVNPSFADAGGSPYEGMSKPLCDTKLVNVANGKSIAPAFTLFTDVPLPGRWKGYIIDDLTVSTDPLSLSFGEKAGMPDAPIGIYDFTMRLVTTVTSDPNGLFEVLLPSTHTMNCPSPSGVCANIYYMLGNDPGQPGALNPNYNPQYRTIGASFEIYPGLIIPSDLAPTQIVPGVLAGGSLFTSPPQCSLDELAPQIYAVSKPYFDVSGNTSGSFTIQGTAFGTTPGYVTLNGVPLPVINWDDRIITVSVPASTPRGPFQLHVRTAGGRETVNGLTFHVLGAGYRPDIYEVGSGYTYATIQSAIDAAASRPNRNSVVVVYPGVPELWNPFGSYFENLIMYSPIKLQGVGPGGVYPDGSNVLGSVLDGRGVSGDTQYAEDWRLFVESLTWDGNQAMYEGAVVYILAEDGEFTSTFKASIDGFTLTGGDQQGFPNNLQEVDPTQKGFAAVQGGGIFANAYANHLQITNNIMQSNGGAYGGAIRIGTPHLPGALNDNQNDFVRIAFNRILANGGTNLAGGIALFSGSEAYEVEFNDICGNFSAEYGGGISHYGLSPNGQIHHNRVYFNRSYDEGGGIMIAGELPADPTTLTPGAGAVDIHANLIQGNLSNDDGGGIRFLMAGDFPYRVFNNMIVNNVSTHEGGGMSLNDAPDVKFYNNTVMKNITTATAMTSNGQPAPAGLASSRNSTLLQQSLVSKGSPFAAYPFSNPVVTNNIFWDNRAGAFTGATVAGIGLTGDPNPVFVWDAGVADGSGVFAPTYSVLQTDLGTVLDASNIYGDPLTYPIDPLTGQTTDPADPKVVETYDTSVQVMPWRGNPRFVDILMVTTLADANILGNYSLQASSAAIDSGALIPGLYTDFDDDARPQNGSNDIGADEVLVAASGFPTAGILDDFNRRSTNLGSNWGGNTQPSRFTIENNAVRVLGGAGSIWWNATIPSVAQEAFFTFTKVAPNAQEQALILKLNGNPTSNTSSFVEVRYDATNQTVQIWTRAPFTGWIGQGFFPATFAAGDQFGARIDDNGQVNVFKNGVLIGSVSIMGGANPWLESALLDAGRIGVRFVGPTFDATTGDDAGFDDFGGGTPAGGAAIMMMSVSAPNFTVALPLMIKP